MARTDTLKNFLADIADKFRDILDTTEKISHADYDTKLYEVYNKGSRDSKTSLNDLCGGSATSLIVRSPFIRGHAFYESPVLSELSLPETAELGYRACYRCNKLTDVYAPNLRLLRNGCFAYCYGITKLHLPNAKSIATDVFAGDNIKALIIDTPDCVLEASNSFIGSAIEKGTGYIYVPDEYVSNYKSATNWSSISARIKGKSDLPEDIKEWLNNGN